MTNMVNQDFRIELCNDIVLKRGIKIPNLIVQLIFSYEIII